MINLMNGYRILRPDERNFVLEHYEEVVKHVKDSEGNVVKAKNAKGKLVTKTIKENDWAFKGYYGTIQALLKGMITHHAMTEDINSLKALKESSDKCIKTAIKEIKILATQMEKEN